MIPGIAPAIIKRRSAGGLDGYYGTGAGDILLHLFGDNATLDVDGETVLSVSNPAGWGSAADVAAVDDPVLYDPAGWFDFSDVNKPHLQLDTDQDFAGVHLLAPIRQLSGWITGNVVHYTFSQFLLGANTSGANFLLNGTNQTKSDPIVPDYGWHLLEGRWMPASVSGDNALYWDGALSTRNAVTGESGLKMRYWGCSTQTKRQLPHSGPLVAVKVDQTSYDADNVEPAVLAAREWLADLLGITLA